MSNSPQVRQSVALGDPLNSASDGSPRTAGVTADRELMISGTADPTPASYTNITTNDDTVVKATPGTFLGIIVNTGGTNSTAIVYDNDAASGTVIGTFATTAQGTLTFNIAAATGITVTTAGDVAADITILWR